MSHIRTSKGDLSYQSEILYSGKEHIDRDKTINGLKVLQQNLDKTGIGWGPAFGTLIGIVRDNGFLPWAPSLTLFVLKEDEERFKDSIWALLDEGFALVRYERRGLYTLKREGQYFDFYMFRKVSYDLRSSGGRSFVFERFLRETVKWDFEGIPLDVPQDLDEYLSFQYGKWTNPEQTVFYDKNWLVLIMFKISTFLKNALPYKLYYRIMLREHKKGYQEFLELCIKNNIPAPKNVELSYLKTRKHRKVLTVGVYDLIHKGHVELFRRAKGLGDHLIVAVQDGDYILKYKPQANVLNSTEDRMYMVKSIRYVDEVVTYQDVDRFVEQADFDVFVSGPDQVHSGFQRAIKWCEENGKEFIILARTDGVSSSQLKEQISKKTKRENR